MSILEILTSLVWLPGRIEAAETIGSVTVFRGSRDRSTGSDFDDLVLSLSWIHRTMEPLTDWTGRMIREYV